METMSPEDPNGPVPRWRRPPPLPFGLPPADLHAQVRRRLTILEVIEKDITDERAYLDMAWNRTLPFNRLPHELLVSIFALVAGSLSANGSISFLNKHHPSVKRTKLILVCRYWRNAVYASPQMWRVIHIRSPEFTERALTLSTPATIDVFFDKRLCDSRNIESLQPHTRRLRSLYFKFMESGWESAAMALFRGDGGTPALENLKLPAYPGKAQEPGKQFVDLRITPERFPRLQSLDVTLAVVPENIEVYSHLRKLSLRSCRCDFSFAHFLDALGASTNLESLELHSTLQHIQGDWVASTASNGCPTSLGHLKSLALIAHPPVYTSRFLSHILLSPTTSVQIDGDLGDVSVTNVTETVPAILPSDPATVLPALRLAKEAMVSACNSEYSISCSLEPRIDEASEQPLITLRVGSSSVFWAWDRFSDRAARDLLRVCASAPLTTLDFTCDCGRIAVETWAEIFTKYTLLETLRLGGDGTIETAFAGLMDAAAMSDSVVPCGRLRCVVVEGPFTETGMDVMLHCLRDRADKGHYLPDLSVELGGDGTAHTLMEEHYIPELEGLVLHVDRGFTINESLPVPGFWAV